MSTDSTDRTTGSAGENPEDRAEPVLACGGADEGTDGFVWCESPADGADRANAADEIDGAAGVDTADRADGANAVDGGFEWCTSASDPDDDRAREGVESGGADGAATDTEEPGYSLPSDLVTTTRRSGIDDETVARLSALRRNPGRGRWQRAAAEFGAESTLDHDPERE